MKPAHKAVVQSLHAFELPSTFCEPNDVRLGPPPQALHYPLIDLLQERFTQRKYRMALFKVLVEFFEEFQRDGLDSQQSDHALGDLWREEHGRTDQEWFDEYFEVLDQERRAASDRLKTGDIHATLRQNGYAHSSKHLGQWLKRRFRGHATVTTVNHHGVPRWVCIDRKDVDEDDE